MSQTEAPTTDNCMMELKAAIDALSAASQAEANKAPIECLEIIASFKKAIDGEERRRRASTVLALRLACGSRMTEGKAQMIAVTELGAALQAIRNEDRFHASVRRA